MRRDGPRTVFQCACPLRSGVIRVSVYGGGREGYLGVLAPDGGGLRLSRSLSPAAMRGFPENIEYAAESGGEKRPRQPEAAPEESLGGGLLWFSTPQGTLTAFDGARNLVALPAGSLRAPESALRTINGRKYIVFPAGGRRK